MDVTGGLRNRLLLALVAEATAFSLPAARGGGWLLLGLAAGALGLLAAGSGAPALGKLRAGVALAFGLAAGSPALAALQGLAAVTWIAMPGTHWPTALLVLAAAGIATPLVEDVLPIPPAARGELTLLAWNTDFPRDPAWADQALAAIRPSRPDIVVLEEAGWIPSRGPTDKVWPRFVPLKDGADKLSKSLGLPYIWSDHVSTQDRWPFHGGCVLLSRYPFETVAETEPKLPVDPPPVFRVRLPDQHLILSPFHLWSPPNDSLASRRQALDQLLRRLPRAHPRVLAGDTNMLPMDRDDLVAARGYQDAAWCSPFYGGTWPAFFPLGRIDAVLLSPELEPTMCRVLPWLGSMHRPVLVRLRVSEAPTREALAGAPW